MSKLGDDDGGRFEFRNRDRKPSTRSVNRLLAWVAVAGVGGLASFSAQFSQSKGLSVFAVAIVVAGASALSGSLIGFLFGIPRVQGKQAPDEVEGETVESESGSLAHVPNSNLIQISDWLTKILVGVGLTQIGNVGNAASNIGQALKPALGDVASGAAFGVVVVLYFLVLGFLVGYIETRTVLSAVFHAADIQGLTTLISARIESSQEKDAIALSLVQQQLDLPTGAPPIPDLDLGNALRQASAPVAVQTFMRAREARRNRMTSDHAALAQVAPIFRALISVDRNNQYHRNHGQLGYILKDQRDPDFEGAIAELTKAMAIRDKHGQTDRYRLYEFNRAECRILRNRDAGSEVESPESIIMDLKAAARSKYLLPEIAKSATIKEWMREAGVLLDAIATDA
jgi:hypothetical protein